jgi:hypothetical protein
VQPIVNLNLHVAEMHGHVFNLGDMDIQNYLGGHTADHRFFYYFGLDTYVPSGRYSTSNLINTGLNYMTFAPNLNVSWNVSPKFELSATLFSEFNLTNPATHYHSGADLDLDYGTTYRPFASLPQLGFGIQGYFYK